MIKPTKTEIQKYLKKKKLEEDQINEKSKDRVTGDMAEAVRDNKPLPQGRCNFCGCQEDKLIPVDMKICIRCSNKFIERGGELKVINKTNQDFHCDNCLSRCFTQFYVNPRICQKCANMVGKRHKNKMKDVVKERAKIKQEKIDRGAIL